MISFAGEAVIGLACIYAALSWLIPAYLLKPPPDDPEGLPRLTRPRFTRGGIAWLIFAIIVFAIIAKTLISRG